MSPSVRDWRQLTPRTEQAWDGLDAPDLDLIAEVDRRELDDQRARVAPHIAERLTEPTWSVRNRLRAWETLVAKMETGWPPDGRYYPEEYANDLVVRDNLEDVVGAFPAPLRDRLGDLLRSLDDRFRAASVEDGGAALRPWYPVAGDRRWWWGRRPSDLPWAG